MEAKEKAKRLVIEFGGKEPALLCVDELLYFCDTQANGRQKGHGVRVDWAEYFNDVKKEINNII